MTKLPTKSYSQAAQDIWALRCNHFATNGFYVDLGAYDGLEHSNTALLEFEYGWQGICVEANPGYWDLCQQTRDGCVLNAAVGGTNGFVTIQGQEVSPYVGVDPCVPQYTLQRILDDCDARLTIDYMSIDIEGAEFETLAAFDFDAYRVHLLTVEHNLYAHGPYEKDRIYELLTSKGFVRTVDNAVCLDAAYAGSAYEDWFVWGDYLPSCINEAYIQ